MNFDQYWKTTPAGMTPDSQKSTNEMFTDNQCRNAARHAFKAARELQPSIKQIHAELKKGWKSFLAQNWGSADDTAVRAFIALTLKQKRRERFK